MIFSGLPKEENLKYNFLNGMKLLHYSRLARKRQEFKTCVELSNAFRVG